MRILNLGINLVPEAGGISRTVTDFVKAERDLGHKAAVVSFWRGGLYEPELGSLAEYGYVRVPNIPVLRSYYWWPKGYLGGMRALLNATDLLMIHGLFFHPGVLAAAWARRLGIPYVLVVHGSLDPWVFSYHRWRKKLWMWHVGSRLLKGATAVIYSTEAERRKAGGWAGSRDHVVHWPVPWVPDYDKREASRRVRELHGLPSGSRIALFCGRIHPSKRPLETIRAFAACAPRDWVLLVVGPLTREIPQARLEAACAATAGRCIYVGPAFGEVLSDYYRAAELFVLFSYKENFSYSTADALAHGVPVLITATVDLSQELAETGAQCAFIARESGPGWMEEQLRNALWLPPQELALMGERGREWVRRRLSFANFRARLSDVLRCCALGR
jgi:glycosyltransferase involved in cell wall biosynthesis